MCKMQNFTTTLPPEIIQWLNIFSSEKHIPKNKIIIEALENLKKEYLKNKIRESYKNASSNQEWSDLGNQGLNLWENQIQKCEK